MATETERKFLIHNDDWKKDIFRATHIRQGYLSDDPERTVRVRLMENLKSHGNKAVITVKGPKCNGSGLEFEYNVPFHDGEQMILLCKQPIIDKIRYIVDLFIGEDAKLQRWEIDEFRGSNDGLILAEIELNDINEFIQIPNWIGEEVTDDMRYANSNLVLHPYNTWISTCG